MSAPIVHNCDCRKCQAMCRNPGWPTPEEARHMLDDGLADRMMLDWWEPDSDIEAGALVLAPASRGCEGDLAPELHCSFFGLPPTKGQCVFQDASGKCGIYDRRPRECATALHGGQGPPRENLTIARMWTTPEAAAIVRRWRDLTGCEDPAPPWEE